ncbi:MAG: histidine kinase [Clostridia bacterium]|nr:histidine kinase [Clostridia bacterium]
MVKEMFFLHHKHKFIKIMSVYRYLSWGLTSFFYCWFFPQAATLLKIGVIIGLFLEAMLINKLYFKWLEKKLLLKMLVIAETVCIALLLMPTGGIDSPFLWYALNPIFMSAGFLKNFYPWLLFALYLVSLMGEVVLFTQHDSLGTMLREHYQLLIVFILIIFAAQLIVYLIKNLGKQAVALQEQSEQLSEANQNLQIANKKIQKAMNLIMSLYQVVEAFNSRDEEKNLTQAFADYAARLAEKNLAFFWRWRGEEEEGYLVFNSTADEVRKAELIDYLQEAKTLFKEKKNLLRVKLKDADLLVAAVKTPVEEFGLMGIEIEEIMSEEDSAFQKQLLLFLVELYIMVFKRFRLAAVNEKLLVAEEQNRIANEIHDSVNQRIYSMACALYTLKEKSRRQNNEEMVEVLGKLEEVATATLKELRSSVYGYSLQKDGERVLFVSIKKYLDSLAYLNQIKVVTIFSGEEERLTRELKETLYRIVCEAAGNALRHGHCTKLEVRLEISTTKVNVLIRDNGKGFDLALLQDEEKRGLGISNMQFLASKEQGALQINSLEKQGTEIQIEFSLK